MKNLLFAVAMLIGFSCFSQSASKFAYLTYSINDVSHVCVAFPIARLVTDYTGTADQNTALQSGGCSAVQQWLSSRSAGTASSCSAVVQDNNAPFLMSDDAVLSEKNYQQGNGATEDDWNP